MNLTYLDIAIIAIPLAIVLWVSIYLRQYMKSVADFLAANRCAGRYLIAIAGAEGSASVMTMIVALELFSKVGWSLTFWEQFIGIIGFILGIIGVVGYRFRQTRALTFHQFFEVRYSRGVRMYSSFLNAFSGILSFGVQPAVGARFFIYFCGFPETFQVYGHAMPSYIPAMIILMAMSVYFALTGGQISVMVTDCLEGVISSIFYLVIAGFLVYTLSISQIKTAMLSGPPGASFVDPFDIGSRTDFNGWYIIIGLMLNLYWFRGNAWNQGFAASAKTPHEGRMSGILGGWRAYSATAMNALVCLGAFTMLHHPSFAPQQAAVQNTLAGISVPQLRTQMQMPVAIGDLLIPGVKGCFCALLLFGLLAGQGGQLHSYGSTFLQDVFLPMRKKPLSPRAHLMWLKITVFGVALFAMLFSIWFKPMDYLVLSIQLLSTLYLGGIGLVVWGGLYWKRGTTAGAWTSIILGSTLSVIGFIFQQSWTDLHPTMLRIFGQTGTIGQYLLAHAEKCPLNGREQTLVIIIICSLGYIIVSLLTSKKPFDLDMMLHRGKYRIKSDDVIEDPAAPPDSAFDPGAGVLSNSPASPALAKRSWLSRFLNIDRHFTRRDKVLTYATFWWNMLWQVVSVVILLWVIAFGRLSANWWFNYRMIVGVGVALVLSVPTTIWFTVGVTHDLIDLLKTLRSSRRSDADDGTVRDHHNLADEKRIEHQKAAESASH